MDGYDTDVAEWSERQAALLRRLAAGEAVNDRIDWDNIIEEVETVRRSERGALRSHIAVVLEHLIKLAASPVTGRRSGWRTSVVRARLAIGRALADSPSLRRRVEDLIYEETAGARKVAAEALAEYGEESLVGLDSLRYSRDRVLGDWFPGA